MYEGETDDFRNTEPIGDIGGYPGAMTEKGKKKDDKRRGKDDDFEMTSFDDLLSMLSFGASDEVDWSDPLS